MSKTFYPKLALSNIKKNKRTYLPYIITSAFIVMMYYMLLSIINNNDVMHMKGL